MKSLLLLSSFLLLFSCGKEQFGTAAQSESTQADALKSFTQNSCSSFTLVRPKVDIVYFVDNSYSTLYLKEALKTSIKNTLGSISSDFDYRIISTPLISTDSANYHVYTNSSEQVPNTSNIVPNTDALIDPIFLNLSSDSEKGLARTVQFMNHHSATGLLRTGAYHLMIIVSNGRDEEIEKDPHGTGQTTVETTLFNQRLASLNQIKSTLSSQQLRFFSATATTSCQSGWRSSQKSYQEMSKRLYSLSGASDSSTQDVYNLCGSGLTNLFTGVNSSIQKVLLKHEYRYWPISFADANEATVDLSKVSVYKVTNNVTELMPTSSWTYYQHQGVAPLNTRELPTAGEPVIGKHFIRFNERVVYPTCVKITSSSKTEYFGYITLPRNPIESSIIVKINGVVVPKSTTNGWSFKGFVTVPTNIKMPYPTSAHQFPEVKKSGYMIQLHGSQNYYKSGDSVDVHYTPAAIN